MDNVQAISSTAEIIVRLASFGVILLVMACLEVVLPMRERVHKRAARWPTNIAMAGLGIGVVRVLSVIAAPLAATGAALYAEQKGLGFFNGLDAPAAVEIALAVIVLDGLVYLQHVASHKFGLLWRLHQVHHADRDLDVTTGIRFHPIEIGLSMIYKSALVVVLGIAPLAVLLFEVLLNGSAMFNHANIRLPSWLDRVLRLVVVTPDMHRIHHSVLRREHDSNYGFALSIWDRMFKTYIAAPEHGQSGMTIGLAPYQSEAPARLGWSVGLPFRPQNERGKRPGPSGFSKP